jgi:Immunity protein 50
MGRLFYFEMEKLLKFPGVELITKVFGYWPSFHDAEIKWLRLDITDSEGGIGPMLEFAIHCFEITDKVSPSGFCVLEKHTLVHFRFRQVSDLDLHGFTNQNAIFGLEIEDESNPTWEDQFFKISIVASSGLGGSFHSRFPEILSAIPCNQKGEPLES